MSSDYGNNYIVLTDQDGNEKEFEHIDTVDMDGETYMAFIPADLKVDEEAEVVILKIAEEDGDEILISVDDDEEADRAFDLIMQRVEDLYDESPQESPEDTPRIRRRADGPSCGFRISPCTVRQSPFFNPHFLNGIPKTFARQAQASRPQKRKLEAQRRAIREPTCQSCRLLIWGHRQLRGFSANQPCPPPPFQRTRG